MEITRVCQRLLTLDEVYAMKRFRKQVSSRNFVCLNERVMMVCPRNEEDVQRMAAWARERLAEPGPFDRYFSAIDLRDGGAALCLAGGMLYVMAENAEEAETLTECVALLEEARQAWAAGEVLAVVTGEDCNVHIDASEVRTRFTAP